MMKKKQNSFSYQCFIVVYCFQVLVHVVNGNDVVPTTGVRGAGGANSRKAVEQTTTSSDIKNLLNNNLSTEPFDDIMTCPSDLIYHYNPEENGMEQAYKDSVEYFNHWLEGHFRRKIEYNTLWPLMEKTFEATEKRPPMFTSVESGGQFILKLHLHEGQWFLPNIHMSLFNSTIVDVNNGDSKRLSTDDPTAVVHTGVVKHDDMTWTLEKPNFHGLVEASKDIIHLEEGVSEYIIFTSGFLYLYQHLLIDHIGYWSFLRDMFVNSPGVRFIFYQPGHNNMAAKMIKQIDPEFSSKILWLKTHNSYAGDHLVVAPPNCKLTLFMPPVTTRHQYLYQNARRWLWNSKSVNPTPRKRKTIIYYTRQAGDAPLGRYMSSRQDIQIKEMIQHAMVRHNREEDFVIFDGHKVSFEEQVQLFQSASIVIGPHGGAFSNLLFTPRVSGNCEKTKVIEFSTSTSTTRLQFGQYTASYYHFFSKIPWIELHHVFYTKMSFAETTYIDIEAFGEALNEVMTKQENSLDHKSQSSPSTGSGEDEGGQIAQHE